MYSILMVLFAVNLVIKAEPIVARRRVSSRDWPQDEPEYEILDEPRADWVCNFERHDCGIANDPAVGQYFQLTNDQISPLTAKRNVLLLNITQIRTNPSGARLITPYFQSKHHSKGCLTIDYMIGGDGIENLVVYQQETQNRCLWSANVGHKELKVSQDWQKLSLGIDLTHGDPRFFIETHFDNRPPKHGFVAISAINFYHNSCKVNNGNTCGKPVSEVPDTEDTTSIPEDDYLNDLP